MREYELPLRLTVSAFRSKGHVVIGRKLSPVFWNTDPVIAPAVIS